MNTVKLTFSVACALAMVIGAVAVAQDQVIGIVAADRIVRDPVIVRREVEQLFLPGFGLQQRGVENRRLRLRPPRVNPRGAVGIEIADQLRIVRHASARVAGHVVAPRLELHASEIGELGLEIPLVRLDEREEIAICTAYRIDGVEHPYPPADREAWFRAEPVCETMPGWQQSTAGCRTWSELPAAARAYLDRLAELCGAPVKYVGIGPEREQTILV